MVGYLKRVLRLIPDDAVLPILFGSLRGSKWIVGSGRKAFWLGIYERHFQAALAKELNATSTFYDIGANVGFYSLLAARKAARVLSFEPVPRNVRFLRQNIDINRLANVEIHQLAISDSAGFESFCEAEDIASGHFGAGKLTVQTERLDSLIFGRHFPAPTHIKMDIEGAEFRALKGAERCFNELKPILFLATHGVDIHRQCKDLLTSWGFNFKVVSELEGNRADVFVAPIGHC